MTVEVLGTNVGDLNEVSFKVHSLRTGVRLLGKQMRLRSPRLWKVLVIEQHPPALPFFTITCPSSFTELGNFPFLHLGDVTF